MKYTVITIATLAVAAAAQPYHRIQHHHLHPVKRQNNVNVVTEYVTATAPAAIVYVNSDGQPISTSIASQLAPTQGSAPPPAETSSQQQASGLSPPAPESTQASPSAPSSYSPPASSSSPPPPAGNDTSSFGYGISYSPYNNDGTCKSQDQVTSDFALFNGYGFVRSYGVDCDQATTMLNAAQAQGMKMFAGIYDVDNVAAETQELIDAVQNSWNDIYAVSVGNEAVNDGIATADQVAGAVNQARSMLRAAGYNGPVVTVDTSAQVIANPQLCEASDFAAANCHAFFNADLTPDQAGPWVLEQAQRISEACGGKDTVITESGWPIEGQANGIAVPSQENQNAAIESLRNSFSNNLVLFSAFNNLWETNTPATFGTNQFWGIYGYAPA